MRLIPLHFAAGTRRALVQWRPHSRIPTAPRGGIWKGRSRIRSQHYVVIRVSMLKAYDWSLSLLPSRLKSRDAPYCRFGCRVDALRSVGGGAPCSSFMVFFFGCEPWHGCRTPRVFAKCDFRMRASPGQLGSSSAVSACNGLAGLAPDRLPAWLFGAAERLCGAFGTMADTLVDQLQ